jgi:hypothetical protein
MHTKFQSECLKRRSHGLEDWTVSLEETSARRIFEGKIVRRIYGPINEGENWRIRTNKELEDMLEGADIVKFIKSLRLRWCGHIERMNNEIMPKQIMTTKTEGTRKRGRPRKRWMDEVEEDLKIMGIRNWHAVAKDRQEWRKILLEAKVHNGL